MTRIPMLLSLFLFSGCNANAGNYLIEAALAPTLTVTPGATKVFLAPFKDKRRNRTIYRGKVEYERVSVDVAARTTLAQSWQSLPQGDLSYLWHRQLEREMTHAGYNLSASAEPLDDAGALQAAKEAGASFLIQGNIKKMGITKRGADDFLGTNFSGTDYTFYTENHLSVKSVDGAEKAAPKIEFEKVFFNSERFGASDRDTFPHYFASGLPAAGKNLADNALLREAVGMPTCTPTPTMTVTPEPTKKGTAAPAQPTVVGGAGVAVPTLTPTPDDSPYWYNPNTGKRVDPKWNFDPADGTPKSKFILKQR